MILSTFFLMPALLCQEVTEDELAAERDHRAAAANRTSNAMQSEERLRQMHDVVKRRYETRLLKEKALATAKRELAALGAQLKNIPDPDPFSRTGDPNKYLRSSLRSQITYKKSEIATLEDEISASAEAEALAKKQEDEYIAQIKASVQQRKKAESNVPSVKPTIAPVPQVESAADVATRLELVALKAEKAYALAQSKPEYAAMIPKAKEAAEKARNAANEAKFKAEMEKL